MGLLDGFRDQLAFLTVIPIKPSGKGLAEAANHIYLFPIIGLIIATPSGIIGLILLDFLPKPMGALFTLAFILFLTGLHHADGLLDFADGVMAKGSREDKLSAMKDRNTGSAGVVSALIVFGASALAISELSVTEVFVGLVFSEIAAKLAMVTTALGNSAAEGSNSLFVESMRSKGGLKLLVSIQIAALLNFALGFPIMTIIAVGIVLTTVGLLVGLFMIGIARKNFGGVTGDVFGATNEVARMSALICFLVLT